VADTAAANKIRAYVRLACIDRGKRIGEIK